MRSYGYGGTLMLFAITLVASGCAPRYPFQSRKQVKLIQAQNKSLEPYTGSVQDKIKGAGTPGALVVVQNDPKAPPAIFPTDDSVETVVANLATVKSGMECVYVFREDTPLPPQTLSCSMLVLAAEQRVAARKHEEQQDAEILQLQNTLDALKKEVLTLNESLGHTKADLKAQEVSLGLTIKVVSFQEEELKSLEDTVRILTSSYKSNSDIIAKNNQQIDNLIKNLNDSFAQTKQELDQIKQKLDTIK